MSNPNFEIWKEPRGFLKCLEVFLAIFAFSCATGFRGQVDITQDCNGTLTKSTAAFQYPFDKSLSFEHRSPTSNCTEFVATSTGLNERHSTEFFVVIGVFCFLLSLGMLIYYIYFEDINAKIQAKAQGVVVWTSGPVVDFALAVFFAFFWFVGSIAQAAAVNGIKDATNVNNVIGKLVTCQGTNIACHGSVDKYATLTVSILLGFLNTFVWCGNTWFLWKETPWHKEPQHTTPVPAAPHQQMPPAAI